MSNKYKLYGTPISPFSYLIHAALIYKKVDFEYVFVDLGAKKQKEPEYLKLHPFGQVPLLVTDEGVNLYESLAIFEYLEEKFPDSPMLPKDLNERAKIRALCQSLATSIIPNARELLFIALGAMPCTEEELNTKRELVIAKLKTLEEEYAKLSQSKDLSPIDVMLYQAWNNLSLAYPDSVSLLPQLNDAVRKTAQNAVIQEIEALPLVKMIRQAFNARFAK